MRLLPTTLLIVGSLVSTGVVVEAQGLAEAAAREKEKRKAQKPVKVFTEEDLRRAGNSGRASVGGDATTAGGDTQATDGTGEGAASGDNANPDGTNKPKEKTSFEVRAEQQKAWRAKMDKAQSDLSKATADIQEIEGILSNLQGYGNARADLLNRLDLTRAKEAQAKQSIEALEGEGRQKGFR